jgi:ABC-2 type transport system permease protein
MREIYNVFLFTLRDNMRKRPFIITTAIVLVLIIAGCLLLRFIAGGGIKDDKTTGEIPDDEKTKTCYIIDEGNLIPGVKEVLAAAFPHVRFTIGEPAKLDEYKKNVETDDSVAVMEISEGSLLPALRFTVTSFLSGFPSDQMAETVRQAVIHSALSNAGVDGDITKIALSNIEYTTVPAGKMDITGYSLGIVLTLLMFFAVYYYGYGVAMSVASEKTTRVMETLVVSAKPSRILLGKCIAMGVLGLIQLSLFIAAAGVGYVLIVPKGFTIGGVPLALSSFTVPSAILILIYFLFGYALYAMINSVCGATVSRSEDLQAAMMPSVLISLGSFYASYFSLYMPNQGFKRIITYIPFTSPFIMPSRLLNENVGEIEIIVSILLLAAATVLVSLISIRLYSASVLHYGQRLKIGELIKLRK